MHQTISTPSLESSIKRQSPSPRDMNNASRDIKLRNDKAKNKQRRRKRKMQKQRQRLINFIYHQRPED